MKTRSYIPTELVPQLDEEGVQIAADAVETFQKSLGWYRLQQKMETLRDQTLKAMVKAAKREHLELAECGGFINAIDTVYEMMEKIKQEGDTD